MLGQPGDVLFDRRRARLLDQRHSRDAGIDVRNRRGAGVEPPHVGGR
jgi:hypothetical protein